MSSKSSDILDYPKRLRIQAGAPDSQNLPPHQRVAEWVRRSFRFSGNEEEEEEEAEEEEITEFPFSEFSNARDVQIGQDLSEQNIGTAVEHEADDTSVEQGKICI